MKTLSILCIVIVGGPVVSDQFHIVLHGVELWDVEQVTDPKFFNDVLVIVEGGEGFCQECKSLVSL